MRFYVVIAAFLLAVFSQPAYCKGGPLKGSMALGYSNARGNTDESDLNADFELSEAKSDSLEFKYKGEFIYGKDNGIRSADQRTLEFGSEFIKSKYDSCYLTLGYMKDEFSGYDQEITVGASYIKYLKKEENIELKTLLGIDFTADSYTDNTDKDETWLHTGISCKRGVAENISGEVSFDYYLPKEHCLDNYKAASTVGFTFTVNEHFDMQMKYKVDYSESPVDGYERTDKVFYTSLVYNM